MPKAKKLKQGEESILFSKPWTYTTFGQLTEIDVYIKTSNTWETIADVRGVFNLDAEEVARLIVTAVNEKARRIREEIR